MIAFLSRNGNNGAKQEEEDGRHYGTQFESCQQVSIERDHQAAHEEEIKSCQDSSCSIDEGWNAILHHQHDMMTEFCHSPSAGWQSHPSRTG